MHDLRVCGVRCAVCGVRCAVCGVRCAVCGVRACVRACVVVRWFMFWMVGNSYVCLSPTAIMHITYRSSHSVCLIIYFFPKRYHVTKRIND